MKPAITIEPDILFSVGAVEEELERIFNDPRFTESAILRKFLSFIVQETIHGRSNCLKEYTIAVNVLEKPLSFNPQENCIVRIHAGRLRRALHQYYNEMGSNDQIVISIPKGKYVPFFSNRANSNEGNSFGESLHQDRSLTGENSLSVAVVPFICLNQDPHLLSFADGLCMRMSTLLMKLDEISVIAYQAVKYLSESQPDLKEFGTSVGVNYVVTGGIQHMKDKLRLTVQLVECATYRQAWCETYERRLTKSNHFDLQDEICQYALKRVSELRSKSSDQGAVVVPEYEYRSRPAAKARTK